MHTRKDLLALQPQHDTFVGIDSDGCVFDTMEIKQKQCFHSRIVTRWRLDPIEAQVRETAEFVNLYSQDRGCNRFIGLIRTMDLLRRRPEPRQAGVPIPELQDLKAFVDSGAPLGNPALEQAAQETGSRELAAVLQWSQDVNAAIAARVKNIPPFPWARESLQRIQEGSDAICVSQTPLEALLREWEAAGIDRCVRLIAGQELGTKTEHIAMGTRHRYAPHRILMIGDAPGDLKAAQDNQALFFPINPQNEADSWQRFHAEAYDRFLAGAYAGAYEKSLIETFEALLPATPPWES